MKIKFSENYYKLPLPMPFKAVLVQILKVHYNDLSKCFISYDTEYPEGAYELPKTDLILLLLMPCEIDGVFLFTTVRRWTPQKWEYYKSLEGKEVDIVQTVNE